MVNKEDYDLDTEEGQRAFVTDSIRKGFNPTREDKQRGRSSLLNMYDAATASHLEEAEKRGAEIGPMKMTAEFWFNKELGVWELQELKQRYPVDLPNFPIQYLRGVYTVDPKFWEGKAGDKNDDD